MKRVSWDLSTVCAFLLYSVFFLAFYSSGFSDSDHGWWELWRCSGYCWAVSPSLQQILPAAQPSRGEVPPLSRCWTPVRRKTSSSREKLPSLELGVRNMGGLCHAQCQEVSSLLLDSRPDLWNIPHRRLREWRKLHSSHTWWRPGAGFHSKQWYKVSTVNYLWIHPTVYQLFKINQYQFWDVVADMKRV